MHEAAILKAQLKCRKTKISKKEVFAKILSQVESDNKRLLYKTVNIFLDKNLFYQFLLFHLFFALSCYIRVHLGSAITA